MYSTVCTRKKLRKVVVSMNTVNFHIKSTNFLAKSLISHRFLFVFSWKKKKMKSFLENIYFLIISARCLKAKPNIENMSYNLSNQ